MKVRKRIWLSQGLFENLTFEKIVQIIRIGLKMPCDKEGCGKRNYVQRMINKLPTVFTIGKPVIISQVKTGH